MTDLALARRRPAEPIIFSLAGSVAVSTSPPWAPTHDSKVYGVKALLGTAGTSNTVVTVYVNGSSVGTVTLGSGVSVNSATLTVTAVTTTDVVTVAVTTAGTGAADLTALVRVA